MNTEIHVSVEAAPAPLPALRGVLASLSLVMLLPSLGTSIANVALPTLAQAYSASFQDVQWIVLAYLLATTALVVSAGRWGDLSGRRRLLTAGILLFTAASVACGFAPMLWQLVAARAVQGVGAALMLANTIALVGETMPKSKTGSAMGLLGTMSAVGTALGPSLGGLLIAWFGWQAIFLVNLPLGLVALWLVQRHLPARRRPPKGDGIDFDIRGTLLLGFSLAAYALAMTLGRGNFGLFNIALLAVAAAGTGLFVLAERQAASPLIRLSMLRDLALSASLAMSTLVATVVMATLVIGPFYLSHSLKLDTALVGLAMSVGPVAAALTGVPAGHLVDRWGVHRMTLVGLVGIAIGSLALALLPTGLGIAGYLVPIVVITAHYALFQTANNTSVMADVGPDQRGVISGLLNLSRNLGLVSGASVMGAMFSLASGASEIATASPQAVATGLRVTFAGAAVLTVMAIAVRVGGRALLQQGARSREWA